MRKGLHKNPINGRPAASPSTEIKNCVYEGLRRWSEWEMQRIASVNVVCAVLNSGYGAIEIKFIAQSPYQNSHYRVNHPAYGVWMGYLKELTSIKNGEFGKSVGMPKRVVS